MSDAPRRTRITDYLIAIRDECSESHQASTGSVARRIGVSNGTASSKLKELSVLGLIELQPYSGATLTPSGTSLCQTAYRRQQLLELFLKQTLQMTDEELIEQAWALEIALGDRCLAAIDDFLGHPQYDLRHDPILA